MSVAQRARGDGVNILVTQDGDLQDTLTDVVDMDATFMTELISKGYLGEPSERKDMIFKGCSFKLSMNLHKQDFVRFLNAVVSKSKRLTPDVVFSITGVFDFPNGETPELTLDDVSFKPLSLSTKGRAEYVDFTIEGECSDIDFQES